MTRKGIVLAGGAGTRLHPLTVAMSKQLLPVYDKPMIYYPLTTLMLAGIREILIISTPREVSRFEDLLGDGSQWGVAFRYAVQTEPRGVADALIIGERFIGDHPSALILGDNIFFGHGLTGLLANADNATNEATVFAYRVKDPERYGVLAVDDSGSPLDIVEKPERPPSHLAITGLYFYPVGASHLARTLVPSARGELEITDLNRAYLHDRRLRVEVLHRGFAWLDTGTHEALHQASSFVETVQERQGMQVASPEEIAWRMEFISSSDLRNLARNLGSSDYGHYLQTLVDDTAHRIQENHASDT